MNPSAKNYLAHRTRFNQHKLALAIAAQIYALSAYAGPTGGEIVGGAGSIEQLGGETTIVQSADRLAIDWQSFDVGKNERVEFVQPGQSAVALNRILGNKGSEILGRIDANGHVILVNPRGVVFGEGAVVNAGGLIASGLQINPDDFMNGDLVFKRIEGTDGTVINSGMINAASGGNVALLGKQVENRGLISAKLGSVILASGKEAVLTFDESGLLGVQVDEAVLQDEIGSSAAVTNSGEIRAESGRVLLSASTTRDVFSHAVNWGDQKQARSVTYNEDGSFTLGAGGSLENSGTVNVSGGGGVGSVIVLAENITHTGAIHADAQQGQGGHVELHANNTTIVSGSGTVTANAEQGGNVKLLGKNVGLFDKSVIEAIGTGDGGTILVGGDREGLNPQVRNANFIYVGEGSEINVSAKNFGDGGTAIVFAEDTVRIYGNLSARGGEHGGDGGFVETSGKQGFSIASDPDLSADYGGSGSWLIDPYNILFEDSGTGQFNSEKVFESGSNNSRISTSVIVGALNQGGSVTLKTGSQGSQDGNITVSSAINFAGGRPATLNLIAHNNIVFNNNTSITASKANNSKLNVNLNANTNISNNPSSQGSITFGNNTRIETGGGDFVIGQIGATGNVDPAAAGAYNVDFSNVTIDVTGPSYVSLGTNLQTFNTYFGNRTPAVANNDRQYLSDSGRIRVNVSNNVNLGGVNPPDGGNNNGPTNGAVTMNVRGRERSENVEKIHIVAGNDITLNSGRVWTYDNNPTEVLSPDQSPYSGYTTLKLEAGRNIDLAGNITFTWNQEGGNTRQEQNDRLMVDLRAGGNVSIGGNITTAGGDFIVRNAVDVGFAGRTINTSSRYGAGSVSINASDDIELGIMPMFEQNASNTAGPLRNPSLTAIAGDTLTLGNANLFTRDGAINLGAARWAFNNRTLNTTQGGAVTLTTAGDLALPTINSTGNVTLAGRDAQQAFTITGSGPQLNGLLTLDLKGGSANIANVVNSPTGTSENLAINSGQNIQLQTPQAIRLGNSALTGNLNLTSSADIRQAENTRLQVGGNSRFSVNNNDVILNRAGNVIWWFRLGWRHWRCKCP